MWQKFIYWHCLLIILSVLRKFIKNLKNLYGKCTKKFSISNVILFIFYYLLEWMREIDKWVSWWKISCICNNMCKKDKKCPVKTLLSIELKFQRKQKIHVHLLANTLELICVKIWYKPMFFPKWSYLGSQIDKFNTF